MLNGIHLIDFGNHRNSILTFGRMTALVGQNGAGKTTVMRAIQEIAFLATQNVKPTGYLSEFRRRTAKQEWLGASWVSTVPSDKIDHGFTTGTWSGHYRRERIPGETKIWIPEQERQVTQAEMEKRNAELWSYLNNLGDGDDTPLKPGSMPGTVESLEGSIHWNCRYFKTSASSLQDPAVTDPGRTTLNEDGSNLAWALSSLMTEHPDRFLRIVSALQEVVPIVKRVRSRAVSLTRHEKQTITVNKQERTFDEERVVPGQELIFDMRSGDGLPASMVSEGTLVVLAVLTLIHGSDDADLIMFDDVELGLHPKAQRDLIRQLRRIQESHPYLQIILSTHSPYVVDEMESEEVWVFAPDNEGCAVVHRLDQHPNAKRALEVLTTGEFWSAEGEGWVLEELKPPGSPSAELVAKASIEK
ncbi:MAG: hypothetical protein JWL59_136 [Chthoniobacteraceae bacterium]|nr:hypothetical protein [Chthoniobacteraceae bacterium]